MICKKLYKLLRFAYFLRQSKQLFILSRLGKNLRKYSHMITFSVRLYVICEAARTILLQAKSFLHKETQEREEKIKKKNTMHKSFKLLEKNPFVVTQRKMYGQTPPSPQTQLKNHEGQVGISRNFLLFFLLLFLLLLYYFYCFSFFFAFPKMTSTAART